MGSVTADQMRRLEEAAFKRGVDPGELMDLAGAGIAARLLDHFPEPGHAIAYIGKGNNGGDALVVLEHLRSHGWSIGLRASHPETERSVLSRQRSRRLGIAENDQIPYHRGPLLLLDGLLGIGASGPPRGNIAALADEMNELRTTRGAIIAAMDLPSGLDADSGELYPGGVTADLTLTVGVVKCGLVADAAADACGRLFLVPLTDLQPDEHSGPTLACPTQFPGLLGPRRHGFHKGHAGRVSLLAGSPGMTGAAILSATGALRGGAGLVRLFAEADDFFQPTAEIMVHRSADRIKQCFESNADALVIGPGLGTLGDTDQETLLNHLTQDARPTVLDADALNLLAASERLDLIQPHHLITPHPGEFRRLAPDLADLPRIEAATRFVERHPCTLLLKGTRTLVTEPSVSIRINPTGHAGMASGGQGDVLAGVCGALLASGMASADAAMLGAWLCGRAAERAILNGRESEHSCTASDTLTHLGAAYLDWQQQRR